MTAKEFNRDINNFLRQFAHFANDTAQTVAGKTAVSCFKKNFQTESFFGGKWKEVKRRKSAWSRGGKTVPNPTKGAKRARKILTGDTSNLGRSIDYTKEGNSAVIFSDVKYAKIHNEGGFAGRNKRVKIPKRQFIGYHKQMEKAVVVALENAINKLKL